MNAPRELEQPTPRSRPQLSWTDTAGNHTLAITERRTAGSATNCELVIADKAVSRIHLEVDPQVDGLWVRDLDSRNGTNVNGVKVTEARLPSGSVIRVGTTDMTVSYVLPDPATEPEPTERATFGDLEAHSPSLRDVFTQLTALAKTETPIIIQGESGSGKKALARAVHDASSRAGGPFVIVECAALPVRPEVVDVLEETLRSAEGGTLVLDAPYDLSLAVQRELGPPLDAKAFRLIVTTDRDLRPLVNQGAFRESLYFRMAGATVKVPPLRQRTPDILPLFKRFLDEQVGLLNDQLVADLERLPWIGNVRELRVYADRLRAGEPVRSFANAPSGLLDLDAIGHVPEAHGTMETPTFKTILGHESPNADVGRMLPVALEPWFMIGFKEFREKWIELGEREYLHRLMQRTSRSSGAASREAGLERTYLYRLIKKHGV